MSKDKGIIISIWVIMLGLLYIYIPRSKVRQGILAALFKQVVTWFVGLWVVERGLIKYPVRFFDKANKTSFSFEYFFYPALCSLFNIYYPEGKSKFIKFVYNLIYSGGITAVEVLAEKYTHLIKYIKWKWYWSLITIAITNYFSRLFIGGFLKTNFNNHLEYTYIL